MTGGNPMQDSFLHQLSQLQLGWGASQTSFPRRSNVIPAQAGIQSVRGKACCACWGDVGMSLGIVHYLPARWIPACAGMTILRRSRWRP